MFVIYMNDLDENVGSLNNKFADDMKSDRVVDRNVVKRYSGIFID